MQKIFSALGKAFGKSLLLLSLLSLVFISSLFIFVAQPSLAAPVAKDEAQRLTQLERADKESQNANQRQQSSPVTNQREQNYEEQIEAEKDPMKVYRENLEAERKANPDEGFVQKTVEKAENLVDKVTGKE